MKKCLYTNKFVLYTTEKEPFVSNNTFCTRKVSFLLTQIAD